MKKLAFAFVFNAAAAAFAAASFSYQGALLDGFGNKLPESDRNKTIQFRLYENETATTPLWGRAFNVTLNEDGYFNVELSDLGSSINPDSSAPENSLLENVITEHADSDFFLGLTVDDSVGEISPRQKVLSVPVATFARNVGEAKGRFSVRGEATLYNSAVVHSNLTVKGTSELSGAVKLGSTQAPNTPVTINSAAVAANGLTITSGGLAINQGDVAIGAGHSLTIGGVDVSIPVGLIAMWSGTVDKIPAGWRLCDGKNGTPDLRGRFIVGAQDANDPAASGMGYKVGATGGANAVTLNIDQIPPHTHWFDYDTQACDNDDWDEWYNGVKGFKTGYYTQTTSAGGGQAHENRPPYYALCYIMRVAE